MIHNPRQIDNPHRQWVMSRFQAALKRKTVLHDGAFGIRMI
jgi:hypothetical protein